MIDAAVSHVAGQLNQYLRRKFELPEDIVIMSSLLEQDGTVPPQVDGKLVLFLVNIEKDTGPRRQPDGDGGDHKISAYPPLYLNLYLMVAGHFTGGNYTEALKFISNAASFFQRRPVIDHANSPELDPRIERLVLDVENLDVQELSNLWSILGSKYLPSILYKIRMVAIDADDVVERTPTVRSAATDVA